MRAKTGIDQVSQNTVGLETTPHLFRGGGQSLSNATRAFFEPRFSFNFGRVRIHTDPSAAESARSINARAYTIGNHIVFGERKYVPETSAGKQLLAHELTHVVQQGSAVVQRQETDENTTSSSTLSSSGSSGGGGAATPFVPPRPGHRVCSRLLQGPLGLITGANHAYVEAAPFRYAIITRCTPTSGPDRATNTAAAKTDASPDPCGKSPTCVDCIPNPWVTDLDTCFRNAYRTYANPSFYGGYKSNSNTFAGTLARACCINTYLMTAVLGLVPGWGGWGTPPASSRAATCPPGPARC